MFFVNGKRTGLILVCCGLGALVAPSLRVPILMFSVSAFPVVLIVLALLMWVSFFVVEKRLTT